MRTTKCLLSKSTTTTMIHTNKLHFHLIPFALELWSFSPRISKIVCTLYLPFYGSERRYANIESTHNNRLENKFIVWILNNFDIICKYKIFDDNNNNSNNSMKWNEVNRATRNAASEMKRRACAHTHIRNASLLWTLVLIHNNIRNNCTSRLDVNTPI